jgi:GNAT superfamily N-acetyltransferase
MNYMAEDNISFSVNVVPLKKPTVDKLICFWSSIFGEEYLSNQATRAILSGKENSFNKDFVFIAEKSPGIVSTAHLTISGLDRRIGGLGEVATLSEYRGKGLAKLLCCKAISEFERRGGKCLFLGTNNPVAARLYSALGYRYIPGTRVMLRTTQGESPEEFLGTYWNCGRKEKIRIVRGNATFRIQIIPLAIWPYDGIVLDANAGLFSIRWFTQKSCMGLYPKYENLDKEGAWFAAVVNRLLVGISSVRFCANMAARIDGFCHPFFSKHALVSLYRHAICYADKKGAARIYAVRERNDSEKNRFLLKLGFVPTEEKMKIEMENNTIELIVYDYHGAKNSGRTALKMRRQNVFKET